MTNSICLYFIYGKSIEIFGVPLFFTLENVKWIFYCVYVV